MAKMKILLGDNNKSELKNWGRILNSAGYEVVQSSVMSRIEKLIRREVFDLAVLDLHWKDDTRLDDVSGLKLARKVSRFIPCIFLTGGAEAKAVVRAFRKQRRGGAAAVDFVIKGDGADALLEAVQAAIVPRVFVVHGHDNEAALQVERFLGRIGTQAILLRDLPGSGRSIIEKLERYSNVTFAVVLLTPDDFGGKKTGRKTTRPKSQPRARQNVILELGYFIDRLGRNHVAVLRKGGADLELPSDYVGVQYLPMDSGKGWQVDLIEEMRSAGIELDL